VKLRVNHRPSNDRPSNDWAILRRSTLVAGLTVSAMTWPSAAPARAACPPVALVEGSAEITGPVSMILTRDGVGAGPSPCGARVIRVSLTQDALTRAYALHIVDGYGRTSDRQVADLNDAASLIESWATEEDADVLLPPPEAAPLVISQTMPASPPPAEGRWRLLAAGEISRARDGSTWFGGAATGCARIGVVCLGGRARLLRDGGRTIFFAADLNRTSADLSAVAAATFSRGRLTVGPIVGVGVRVTRSNLVTPPLAFSGGPLAFSADDYGFHGEAAAVVAVALARRWSVVAEIGGSAGILFEKRGSYRPNTFLAFGAPDPGPVPPLPPGADFHVALGCQFRP
jgi:hypothetical protein